MLSLTTWHTNSKNDPYSLFSSRFKQEIPLCLLLRVAVDKHWLTRRTTGCCCGYNDCEQHQKPTCYKFRELLRNDKTNTLSIFMGRVGVSVKNLDRSRDGLKRVVKRLQSGIFSVLLELHWLTAEAHYLLGKTHWKKHGRRPPACISSSGWPDAN